MPSHIFTRVGAWADSAATNQRSADTAKKGNDKDEQMHALDYMVYAYLQLARDNEARSLWRKPPRYPDSFVLPGRMRSPQSRRVMRLSAVTGVQR